MSPYPSSQQRNVRGQDKVEHEPPKPQRLYYPSVFRYNCYGMFYADTWNNNNSHKDSRLPPSGGTCYGIKSNLSQVRSWHHPSTEQQSLDLWLRDLDDPAQYLLDGRPVVQQSSSSSSSPFSPSTTMSTTTDSRSGMKNGSRRKHDSDDIFATLPILVYPTTVDHVAPERDENSKNVSASSTTDYNDNTDTHAYRHKWSARGKTKVLVLVGQPQITDLDSSMDDDNHNFRQNDDYDEDSDRSITHQQLLQQGKIMATIPRLEYGTSVHTVDLPPTKCQVSRTLIVGPMELVLQTVMPPAPEPGTPLDESTSQQQLAKYLQDLNLGKAAMQGGQQVYDQSGKIITHMKRNAGILRDAVKDDFPNRCLSASGRIVNQFGATLNNTVTLMQDLYRYWNDDDDDDDHYH